MKRKSLNSLEKWEIIKEYDQLMSTRKMSNRSAATVLNISKNLMNIILKNREEIEKNVMLNINPTRRRKRTGKEKDVEDALKQWYLKLKSTEGLTGPMLQAQAEAIARKMGKVNFVATTGWFRRWMARENIVLGRKKTTNMFQEATVEMEFVSVDEDSSHDGKGSSVENSCEVDNTIFENSENVLEIVETNCELLETNCRVAANKCEVVKPTNPTIVEVKAEGSSIVDNNQIAANEWLLTHWNRYLSLYAPEDIYNVHETVLFFRVLPESAFQIKSFVGSPTMHGKDRLSLVCCASMTGEKKRLLVVGNTATQSLKYVNLPVDFIVSKNALMTKLIFNDWLQAWDATLKRQILLLMHHSHESYITKSLKRIQVVFVPDYGTALIQPCEQGIIRTVKALYRIQMRKMIIARVDEHFKAITASLEACAAAENLTYLEAVHLANQAWTEIRAETIRNCFRRGSFYPTEIEKEFPIETPTDLDDDVYNTWMEIDSNAKTMETDNSIPVTNKVYVDDLPKSPSNREMLDALEVLRRGVHLHGSEFQLQYQYENLIYNIVTNT